ncbi:MAG: hypothetical protein B7X01_03600, partial [Acidiphilium sp. 21-62-4]
MRACRSFPARHQAKDQIMNNTAKPLWNPYVAGGILGLGLLATFLVTGHGLGVTGATTALTAKVSGQIAPGTVAPHSYLGTYFKHSLNIWVVWEVIGLMLGALGASLYGRRFKLKIDGPPHASVMVRIGLATLGGLFSGFGARAAMHPDRIRRAAAIAARTLRGTGAPSW